MSTSTPASQYDLAQLREGIRQDVFLPEFVKAARAQGVRVDTQADLDNLIKVASAVEASEARRTAAGNPLLKMAADRVSGPSRVDLADFASKRADELLGLA